jgi:hypothetical protein
MHVYEVRPRTDKRDFDLISDSLPFGWLWYGERNAIGNAIGYAEHCSRSHILLKFAPRRMKVKRPPNNHDVGVQICYLATERDAFPRTLSAS